MQLVQEFDKCKIFKKEGNYHIKLKFNNTLTSCEYMFKGCHKIVAIDFSSFDTSKVTDMSYMFEGCKNLINVDLSSFDTSKVTDMQYMFHNCIF